MNSQDIRDLLISRGKWTLDAEAELQHLERMEKQLAVLQDSCRAAESQMVSAEYSYLEALYEYDPTAED
jgi:hypothetical protein